MSLAVLVETDIPPAEADKLIAATLPVASLAPLMLNILIVSEVPTLANNFIADSALSFEETKTWPPAISTSFAAAASMFTPPAVEVKVMADSAVPSSFNKTIV